MIAATHDSSVQQSQRLFIKDVGTGHSFLVDSGAEISVLPARYADRRQRSDQHLYAANGTSISTYGQRCLTLTLGFRRNFRHQFIIADVTRPILGADFLVKFGLLIDLKNRRLIDTYTQLTRNMQIRLVEYATISTVDHSADFARQLRDFPGLTQTTIHRPCRLKHNTVHVIETRGHPVTTRARRLNPEKLKAAKEEFEDLLERGDIRPSNSPWASPLHVVAKKGTGLWRVCGDYRLLNTRTQPDRYPIPNIQDFNAHLANTCVYTKLDLERAYHQIPMSPEDIPKTAVITPFGLYEYTVMPFGLRNAGQTFQRFMDSILRGLNYAYVYLDDILIASKSKEEHEQHVHTVLQRLDQAGLILKVSKCVYAQESIQFLGHNVSSSGITPTGERSQAILDYPQPQDVQGLRRFLGMMNFYRRSIANAAQIQTRLQILIKTNKKRDTTPLEWTDDALKAFHEFKHALANATTLAHPDDTLDIILCTDASESAIGGALYQIRNGEREPLSFFSRKLSLTERRYSPYDRELLAIFASIRHFQSQVEGRRFSIYTDHKPLIYALVKNNDKDPPRRTRQLDYIAQFSTDIRHLSGNQNIVADALSRIESLSETFPLSYMEIADSQDKDEELKKIIKSSTSGLRFKPTPIDGTNRFIFTDISTGRQRVYLPPKHRYDAFFSVHRWSHPGPKATAKMVANRFVWKGMQKDCNNWAKACQACQKSKITRHTRSPLGHFEEAQRFEHVHMDIIGPFPPSQGKRFVVTMIDRRSKWPEAEITDKITAPDIADIFLRVWVARFGAPARITTDQGRQFDSHLIRRLAERLGSVKIRTTAYHPQANGQVERWHRVLKAAIIAYSHTNWVKTLPLILLGLRSAVSLESGVSPAQLTLGQELKLPGDFFVPNDISIDEPEFVRQLATALQGFQQKLRRRGTLPIYTPTALSTCSHVFLRAPPDANGKLTAPYAGPYQVIRRDQKVFRLAINGEEKDISIDRLKPAFLLDENKEPETVPEKRIQSETRPRHTRAVKFKGPYPK